MARRPLGDLTVYCTFCTNRVEISFAVLCTKQTGLCESNFRALVYTDQATGSAAATAAACAATDNGGAPSTAGALPALAAAGAAVHPKMAA